MTEYSVTRTVNRDDSKGNYIVRLTEEAHRRHFGRRWVRLVLVTYKHPRLESRRLSLNGVEVSVIARLRSPLKNASREKDNVIEIDQALRRALGLPVKLDGSEKVTIHEMKKEGIWLDLSAKIVGRRFANCRPTALHSQDVEQRIVRLRPDVLDLLGIKSGETVVLCGVQKDAAGNYRLNRHYVSALEASPDYVERLLAFLPAPADMDEKFAHISEILYPKTEVFRDLSPIFLDKDARDALFGPPEDQWVRCPLIRNDANSRPADKNQAEVFLENVQYAQPVLIYRAPFNAITNEIMAIFFTAVALTFTFDQWLSRYWSKPLTLVQFFMVLVSSFALAIAVAALKTRNLR
jgi:hypothetical protein